MLYVQVTSAYRSSFGLRSNPGLIGDPITVAGSLTAYFSHPGLKSPTAMTAGGTTSPTTAPTTAPTTGPTGGTDAYYAAAAGTVKARPAASAHLARSSFCC